MSNTRKIQKPWVSVHDPKPWVHGTQTPVRVVLHDTESHNTAGIEDISGVFNFWHTEQVNGQAAEYGAHFIVDRAGRVGQGADPDQEQWHVANYNSGSIGIEQIGYSTYTSLMWSRSKRAQLVKVARILAWLHTTYKIPLKLMTLDEIRAGAANPQAGPGGVTRHRDVGLAGVDPTGHVDPGTGYPIRLVLWLANRYVRLGGWSESEPV